MRKGALARDALKKMKGNGKVESTKTRSPALRAAIDEAWKASKADDAKAFGDALESAIRIGRNIQ